MYVVARRGLRCASNEPAKLIASRRKAPPKPTHSIYSNSSRNISIFPWGQNGSNQEHNAAVWNNEKGRWEPLDTSFITSTPAKQEVDREASQGENNNSSSSANGAEEKDKSNNYGSAFRRSQRNKKPKEIPSFTVPFEFLSNNVRRHKFDSALSQGFLHLSGLEGEEENVSASPTITDPSGVSSTTSSDLKPSELTSERRGQDVLLVKFYASFQECCKLYAQMQEVYGDPGENAKNWEDLPDMLSEMPNLATKWDRVSTEFEEIAGQAIAAFPDGELGRKLCDDLELDGEFAKEVSELEANILRDRNHDPDDTTEDQPASKSETQAEEESSVADYLPQYFLNHVVFSEVLSSISAGLALSWSDKPDPLARNKMHLKLLCPVEGGIYFLDKVVEEAASRLGADVTILDPQDLSEMVADYIGEGPDEATEALSSLGFETSHVFNQPAESMQANEDPENEEDGPEELAREQGFPSKIGTLTTIPLSAAPKELQNIFRTMFGPGKNDQVAMDPSSSWLGTKDQNGDESSPSAFASSGPKVAYNRQNEVKLTNLLERLISANQRKREWLRLERKKILSLLQSRIAQRGVESESEHSTRLSRSSKPTNGSNSNETEITSEENKSTLDATRDKNPDESSNKIDPKSIILLRNFKEITHTPHGAKLVEKLVNIIGQRRQNGARIMLVGTSSFPGLADNISATALSNVQKNEASEQFRALVVAPETNRGLYYQDERRRFREINGRHIYRMLTRMEPRFQDPNKKRGSRWFAASLQQHLKDSPHAAFLEEQVLTFDEVHRIVFTALGQRSMEEHTGKDGAQLELRYISDALNMIKKSDEVKSNWAQTEHQLQNPETDHKEKPSLEARLKKIRKSGTQHEKNLLRGVVDPENIHTTFNEVHAPTETIEALKTLTTLSLTRPEAFKYGVLARDKITGLLLYGPPGTGKTLLAKAVARESGAIMLEVSGSDVYDMYVGEGEKNVRAIFSLAKKLAPCVVFIDEADAIFASRGSGTNRNSHRELINQFLREWDGMTETSAFIMVATNRPFDLDDAALRRLPRRLLVDLPSEKDREAILGIHLKEEALEQEVSLSKLASQTPLYSGSDLKNLAVAAALAAVRDENDEAAKHTGEKPYQFPEKRTLGVRHFEKAMEEISASVNEDMSSLGAIRKFDEKYGDRRGRRKKTSYGFSGDGSFKEETAKVRT